MLETTLIGIKPDAFSLGESRESRSALKVPLPSDPMDFVAEVRTMIQERGLTILDTKQYRVPPEIAREHYSEHLGIFDESYGEDKGEFLVWYLSSGDSYWFVVSGEGVMQEGRAIIISIRDKYLNNRKLARYNMTHASDAGETAAAEIALHFSEKKYTTLS